MHIFIPMNSFELLWTPLNSFELQCTHIHWFEPFEPFELHYRQENETESSVSVKQARATASPQQWLPDSARMSNSMGFDIMYENGTAYNISQTTPDNEFEIWMDNKIDYSSITFVPGGTAIPPVKMAMHTLLIPKVNALNNIKVKERAYIKHSMHKKLIKTNLFYFPSQYRTLKYILY